MLQQPMQQQPTMLRRPQQQQPTRPGCPQQQPTTWGQLQQTNTANAKTTTAAANNDATTNAAATNDAETTAAAAGKEAGTSAAAANDITVQKNNNISPHGQQSLAWVTWNCSVLGIFNEASGNCSRKRWKNQRSEQLFLLYRRRIKSSQSFYLKRDGCRRSCGRQAEKGIWGVIQEDIWHKGRPMGNVKSHKWTEHY